MKDISTLVDDIYKVIEDRGGWDSAIHDHFMGNMGDMLKQRMSPSTYTWTPRLRMSNIGTECDRRVWLDINDKTTPREPMGGRMEMLFMYGDILEELVLALAMAAGHTVTGQQDMVSINGIRGKRDAVIDGVVVDVKSTSVNNFKKFTNDGLIADDPFGYIKQLEGYVHGALEDPLVTDKEGGAFLVINKSTGEIVLDYHKFPNVSTYDDYVEERKDMIRGPMPDRYYDTKEVGAYGNTQLHKECGFCPHKKTCFPDVRSFELANGFRVHFDKINREPRMKEVT